MNKKDPIEERYAGIIAMFGTMTDEELTILKNKLRNDEASALADIEAHGYAEGYEIGYVQGRALSVLFGKLADQAVENYSKQFDELIETRILGGTVDPAAVNPILEDLVKKAFLLGSSTMYMNQNSGLSHIEALREYVAKHSNP